MTTLFTIGHGTLTADELSALVRGAGIDSIVDVRSHPGSRRHPHFARAEMQRWLANDGLDYRWEPGLGGRRRSGHHDRHPALRVEAFRGYAEHMETAVFDEALERVLQEAGRRPTAVMCAESLWWRCHRRLVADAAVVLRAARVRHLFHDGRLVDHRPMPEARVECGRLVYDAGEGGL